ncbi:MAG: aminotransferase class V-fold PLP-dependent enzyme [Deltaproteobacteria bacterium]
MKTIYVDNNATTRVAPEVFEEMTPYFTELYGNPSSMHFFGGQVQRKVEEARERVAALLGAQPQEIIFTSCGTESDNAAIMSALQCNPEKRHLLTTRVEHPAVKNLVAALAESRGIVFHTDAVQAVGKFLINLAESQIDMLSLSGHKLHAPKGIGVLYVRRGTRFAPFVVGGHQEEGRRGGTENVPYIIGLGKACELAAANLEEENLRVKNLRDKLENGLLEKIENSMINGDSEQRLPNTSSISFEYVEGESILLKLSDKGICASSGSACTSGSLEPSHVLRAMGVPFTAAHGSIRFSLSTYNTEEEIDYILEVMPPIIEQLRAISPFWKTGPVRSCSAS